MKLLRKGLCVTINSMIPLTLVVTWMTTSSLSPGTHPLTKNELAQFSINAIEASFVSPQARQELTAQVANVTQWMLNKPMVDNTRNERMDNTERIEEKCTFQHDQKREAWLPFDYLKAWLIASSILWINLGDHPLIGLITSCPNFQINRPNASVHGFRADVTTISK